jgi:hypothetical protein
LSFFWAVLCAWSCKFWKMCKYYLTMFLKNLTWLSKTNKTLILNQLRKLQKIPTNKVINVKFNDLCRFSSLPKFSALLLQFQCNFFNAFEINVEFSSFWYPSWICVIRFLTEDPFHCPSIPSSGRFNLRATITLFVLAYRKKSIDVYMLSMRIKK